MVPREEVTWMMLLRAGLVLSLLVVPALASGADVVITEVFYDHSGGDDGFEWVELYNSTPFDVDLSGYSLGWGGTDYTYGTAQLSGMIPACDVWVVGGPTSDAENGNPFFDLVINFDDDIQNGGTASDGVALFDVEAALITPATVPVDVVIYDEPNANNLMDETGAPGLPEVGDAPSGSTIERIDWADSWQINPEPGPGFIQFESPLCSATPMDESRWGLVKAFFR
jgi:hypothetical protein